MPLTVLYYVTMDVLLQGVRIFSYVCILAVYGAKTIVLFYYSPNSLTDGLDKYAFSGIVRCTFTVHLVFFLFRLFLVLQS